MTVSPGERSFSEDAFRLTDPRFFTLFHTPLTAGTPDRLLSTPDQILVTERTARNFFGPGDPIGRTLTLDGTHPFTVAAAATLGIALLASPSIARRAVLLDPAEALRRD